MPSLTVSPTNDYLLKDGRPFFYLADTVWAAFANLSTVRASVCNNDVLVVASR